MPAPNSSAPRAWKSEGIIGQPETQYYFHRPLEALLVPMFAAVVAEGVETDHELEFLRENGCDFLQGFHCGRPGT